MIELLIEFIASGLGELVLQIALEIVVHIPFEWVSTRSAFDPEEKKYPSWAPFVCWICAGFLLGLASLIFFPDHLIRNVVHRFWSLIFTPILLGGFTWTWGRLRDARDKVPLPMDTFWYGYGFGLLFSLARLAGAR